MNFSGRPVWHVSVSWQTAAGPVPLRGLKWKQLHDMNRVVTATLRSVGTGESFPYDEHLATITVQRRKLLSDDEVAALPQRLLPDRWVGPGELDEGEN